MKNPILFLAFIGLFLGKTKAFSQKNERFKSEVFSTFDSLKNIQYGQTVNLKEATEKLFLDIYSPNAVISCWGALSDLNLMKKGDIPIFSIHGMADKTVPYDSSFSSHGFRYGSLALNSRAAALGIPTGMKLFENTGHTLDSDKAKQNQGLDEACKWLFAIIEKKKSLQNK